MLLSYMFTGAPLTGLLSTHDTHRDVSAWIVLIILRD